MTTVLIAAIAIALLAPVVSDLVSLLRLARGRPRRDAPDALPRSRILYLIPAHNEEELIATCVRSVIEQRYPARCRRVVVLADNCRDRTARIARENGAECLEREDAAHPGKPRAVAWALGELDLSQLDAVVILDADAVVAPDHASELDRAAPLRDKVLQCYDDVRNGEASALTRMAAVFAAGRFRAAYRLKHRAGLTIPLSDGLTLGTGVIAAHPWRAFSLSEDVEAYAQLTAAGVPIELAEGARLFAQETHTLRQSRSQRARWLAGRWQLLARAGPELVRSRKIGAHQVLDALSEIAMPGPALHAVIVGVVLTVVALSAPSGASVLTVALVLPLARHAAYAAIGVVLDAHPARAIAAFAFLPIYALWRCVTALRSVELLRGGPWVRTAR